MSRLDWFTILIVGVCVVALGFLVYKTIQLMGNEKTALPRTEISKTEKEASDPLAYQNTGETKSDSEAAPGGNDEDLDDDELTYDPKEVEAPAQQPAASDPAPVKNSNPPASKPAASGSTSSSQPKSQPVASSTTTAKGAVPSSYESNSSGNFMVVAGSFSQKYNAESQVKLLKDLGYANASVEIFNNGALATALVDRFSNYEAAKKLVAELKVKGVDAFVKRKK